MPNYYPRHSQGETYRIVTACDNKVWLTLPTSAVEVTGLAMPPMEHRTVRAPYQQGETWLGSMLRPRPVQVSALLRGLCRPDLWALRQFMVQAMNPLLGPFKFQVLFDSGEFYELRNVVFDTGFDDQGRRDARREVISFRLLALDPVWYGVEEEATAYETTWTTSLVLPASFPITFGVERQLDETLVCTNRGNWTSYPIITLVGGLYDPVIENLTTGEIIRLRYNLVDTEVIVIDLTPGKKTVTTAVGYNFLGKVSEDSDLATFHLDPAPLAADGVNYLHCTGAATPYGDPRIVISWHHRYLGV